LKDWQVHIRIEPLLGDAQSTGKFVVILTAGIHRKTRTKLVRNGIGTLSQVFSRELAQHFMEIWKEVGILLP